ncbi:MAG: sugar ABC transporter permease [Phycisphaerae bacterium]|nr:sugar ABC transporter permease [Phycisphaerae bacterium]
MKRSPFLVALPWITPWIIGFAAFLAAPIAMSLWYSLNDYSLLEPAAFVGLDNYKELAGDPLFWRVTRNTLVYGLVSSGLAVVLSLLIAALLEARVRGAALVRAIVFIPTLVPAVSGAVSWLWLFNPRFGLINSALSAVGVDGPDWLGSTAWAMPSLVVMGLWVIGSSVLVYSAALRDVPRALYESASIDGVGRIGRFRHVTLPLVSPAILFNGVMSLIWSLQLFAPPHLMTRGGPEETTYTYSMYVYNNAFIYGRMGYASALAWLQILVTLALTLIVLAVGRRFVYYRAA